MKSCYEGTCNCSCNDELDLFNEIISKELNTDLTLNEIVRQNIGWFSDRDTCDHMLNEWGLKNAFGLYFIWYKEDYCADHDLFHMTCKYIGKGHIVRRLINHYNTKNFDTDGLLYFTFIALENRLAKYFEQLFLDIYDIPLNNSEKKGKNRLCAYFTQNEVD